MNENIPLIEINRLGYGPIIEIHFLIKRSLTRTLFFPHPDIYKRKKR